MLSDLEDEAAAGQRALGLRQLRGRYGPYIVAQGRETLAGPRELGCEQDRAADTHDVGRARLRRVDGDAVLLGKGTGIDPLGVDEEGVVRDRGHR